MDSTLQKMLRPFGELLRNRRKAHNLTQKELAAQIGALQTSVSEWETGRSVPSSTFRERLQTVLEISDQEIEAALWSEDEVVRALKSTAVIGARSRDALVTLYREAARAHRLDADKA
jgi:transcriptional regulator with XRE-family HTH domain